MSLPGQGYLFSLGAGCCLRVCGDSVYQRALRPELMLAVSFALTLLRALRVPARPEEPLGTASLATRGS